MSFSLLCPHHQVWSLSQRSRVKKPEALGRLAGRVGLLLPDPLSPNVGPGRWSPDPHPLQLRPQHLGKEQQLRPRWGVPFTRLAAIDRPSWVHWAAAASLSGGERQDEVGEPRVSALFTEGRGASCSLSLKAPRDSCLRPWRGESQGRGRLALGAVLLLKSQPRFWRLGGGSWARSSRPPPGFFHCLVQGRQS